MEKFDIIIKNGRVWDGQKFLGSGTYIAIKGGVIAKIGAGTADEAEHVFDAEGMTVLPGLVDIHVHMRGCSDAVYGVPAEASCFPFGVTAAAEAAAELAGGARSLDDMLLKTFVFIAPPVKNNSVSSADIDRLAEEYGKRLVGVKMFLDASNPNLKDVEPFCRICDYAHRRGLKVLVHTTGSPVPFGKIFDILAPGDICTHIFHGGAHTAAEDNFESHKRAKQKGIILDVGMAGGVHTDFAVAKAAIESGVIPCTISTDITKRSVFVRGGNYGMTLAMSIMRHLQMPEEEIFAAVTHRAAKAIGAHDTCGKIEEGRCADIAVITWDKGDLDITDRAGNNLKSSLTYSCRLTIADGQVVCRSGI